MVIGQGDVCWTSLDDPVGSSPGFRRPVAVVQADAFNASRIATRRRRPAHQQRAPGCRTGERAVDRCAHRPSEGLGREPSQIVTIDRSVLTERVGRLAAGDLQLVLSGIDLVLGRE